MSKLPILYSFRRCPYAMRARIALAYNNVQCILREVDLKNKPEAMLEISPKGTVPVLLLNNGKVIEESLDIIYYALEQEITKGSRADILTNVTKEEQQKIEQLITNNDTEFAKLGRKYKYFEKYPEESQKNYRTQIEKQFLQNMEQSLSKHKYLISDKLSIADIALMPFIRQFAYVDEEWFFNSSYNRLINWLNNFTNDDLFEDIVMQKHKPWKFGDKDIMFLHL
ncbi:MAG: glutathione S-transferase N-terminal domain-containing protein [Rickettsiaceae bacterium]|nr:glutathione S-transferase N-terminal domain-containing protein [Rickettsiaceae bacterium]